MTHLVKFYGAITQVGIERVKEVTCTHCFSLYMAILHLLYHNGFDHT